LHQAGEQARGQYANEQAMAHFRRALALLGDVPSDAFRQDMAVRLYEGLGDVLHRTGHYDEARSAYQDALAVVPAGDRIARGQLHCRMGWTWESQHRPEDSIRAYNEAESALGREPPEVPAAWWSEWLIIQLSRIDALYFQGQWREMMESAERIRPVLERYGTPRHRLWLFSALVGANNTRDRFRVSKETIDYCRANVEAAQQSGSIAQLASRRFGLGFNLLWYGETGEAKEQLQTALELATRVGDTLVQTRCLNYLAVACRICGHVEETEGYALRTLEAAVAVENLTYIGTARGNLAWVAWREGDRTQALEHGRAALELAQRFRLGPFHWMWLCPLIAVALADDRIADAVAYAAGLVDPTQQRLPHSLEATLEGAMAAWERDDVEQARTHLERAAAQAREMGYL
jgi:tetratricopeptide (TPR) repeat protein